MIQGKWLLAALCATGTLLAQTVGDLNGLTQAAAKYVSHGLAGNHDGSTLELYRVIGNCDSPEPALLGRGIDVTHWAFQYKVVPFRPGAEAAPHLQVVADCNRGIFGNFGYSDAMVTDARSIEFTWVAISLDEAITQLKKHGYTKGFKKVTLMRPMNPNFPDEYVYIFECPADGKNVAISTQTGVLSWTEAIG
jgi:hypothetical protein